jgi:hypothetical protein
MKIKKRLSVAAFFALAALSGPVAFAQQSVSKLAGLTPTEVKNGSATLMGPASPDQVLRLVIGLQRPNQAAEEEFLRELGTKGSPNFQKFLTADEWNGRFSPSAANEQAVVAWAQAQGMTITHRFANRLLVDLQAPVATVERALAVKINRYQLGSRIAFSHDVDPTIPAGLTNIIHSIGGLNSIQVLRPASRQMEEPTFSDYAAGPPIAIGPSGAGDAKVKRAFGSAAVGITPDVTNGAYDPSDIYNSAAYDVAALNNQGHCCNPLGNPGVTPPETSIAIATAGAHRATDYSGFAAAYPGLAYHYQEYYIDGTPDCCDTEGTMDFEWATAWSNSFGSYIDTAMIYMYDGADNHLSTFTDAYNQILSDGHARVFSTSWGCEETTCTSNSTMDTDHGIFNAMVGQGWTLVAASADNGATGGCGDALEVSYPASDPNVVGAGGTTLHVTKFSNGAYAFVSETGWAGGPAGCAANDGGSTGGASTYYSAPPYQTALPTQPAMRNVPDIALNADWYHTPQNYYYNGALHGNGGTSIVAPSVAGFFAQANAYLDYVATQNGGCSGAKTCAPIGNANYYLYIFGEAPISAPHYPFYDIVSGCNSNDITTRYGLPYFCAASGYDQVTGWGSFNALQLARAIVTYKAGDAGVPSAAITGPLLNHWYNKDQLLTWQVTDAGGELPSVGVAGYTFGWDNPITDSFSEPTPNQGSTDSFYAGVQIPNATTGRAFLSSAGQGCHTIQVRSWNNSGKSGYNTYGPVCYDTVPPVSFADLQGALSNGVYAPPVFVDIGGNDGINGSGYNYSSYNLDGAGFVIYPDSLNVSALGAHRLLFRSVDAVGNTEVAKTLLFTIKSPTTTTLTSSLNSSTYGQSVTFTATVAATAGDPPTGTVTFMDGAAVLGKAALTGGVASLTTKTLHAGLHAITATYAGSATDAASASANLTQTVNMAASKMLLTSSLNPSVYGQAVTLTAKVTSSSRGAVSGTVAFSQGSIALGTQAIDSTNTATLVTTAILGGTRTITATYSGSGDNTASSKNLIQTVTKAATTTVLASSANPSTFGSLVTLTATVTGANGGATTGSLTFKDGTIKLAQILLVGANHRASFSTTTLAKGNHNIAVLYSGSGSTDSSIAEKFRQVVN